MTSNALSTRHHNTDLFVLAALVAMSIPVEYRIPFQTMTLGISELLAVSFTILSIVKSKFKTSEILAVTAVLLCGIISYAASDFYDSHLTALRNILVGGLFFWALQICDLSTAQRSNIVRCFLISMTGCAVLGIAQAIFGYGMALTIYDILPPEVAVDNRLWLLGWKLNEVQAAGIFAGQKALATGLSSFSNGFAELLVYGICGILCLGRDTPASRSIQILLLAIYALALLLSASRTGWLGGAMVLILFLLLTAPKKAGFYIVAAISLPFAISFSATALDYLSFDAGGTLRGRMDLNINVITIILSSVQNAVIGGGAEQYLSTSPQIPHSTTLYLALMFGIPAAIAYIVSVLLIFANAMKTYVMTRHTPILAASLATLWFGVYGETWASVASSNEIMIFAIFATMAAGYKTTSPINPAKQAMRATDTVT